jgi:hypothetical protein
VRLPRSRDALREAGIGYCYHRICTEARPPPHQFFDPRHILRVFVNPTFDNGENVTSSNCDVNLSRLNRIVRIRIVIIPRYHGIFSFKKIMDPLNPSLERR